ncbi:MAG: OsmC family protein [Thermoanaerobaculia bacterium]
MTGTFAGALEARRVDAGGGKLRSQARGEIETEDGVLVIKRIHVRYLLEAPEDARETVERVHSVHASHCPVYRSIHRAIDVTTSYELVG